MGEPNLVPLSEAKDYKVAPGYPDPRDWDVLSQGTKVGKVDKLIADLSALKVRYLDVKLDDKFSGGQKNRHVLLPVGSARLDDKDDKVLLQGIAANQLTNLPSYTPGERISRDFENSLRGRLTGAPIPTPTAGQDYYANEFFDENRFFGNRGAGQTAARGQAQERVIRVPVSEEELVVGKRQVQAGEVDVRKTVETEHVQRPVTRMREEVEVERRPIPEGQEAQAADLKGDEIRVPLMEEEVVVEKRPVTKEEVVIRKRAVEDTENVEADVRRERVDISKQGERVKEEDEGRRERGPGRP
jgi:uncharacterized protein (TIGR02271 family)